MATVNARDAGIAVNGSYSAAIEFVGSLLAAGAIEIEGDLVKDSVELATELAREFAKARLALQAEVVADYPDAPKGGGGGGFRKSGGNSRPRSGGSTQSTAPATEKQVNFVTDLLASKAHSLDVDTSSLTKAEAAKTIEALLALPDAE